MTDVGRIWRESGNASKAPGIGLYPFDSPDVSVELVFGFALEAAADLGHLGCGPRELQTLAFGEPDLCGWPPCQDIDIAEF